MVPFKDAVRALTGGKPARQLSRPEWAALVHRLNTEGGYTYRQIAEGFGWRQPDGEPARGKVATLCRQHRARAEGAEPGGEPEAGADREAEQDGLGAILARRPAVKRATFARVGTDTPAIPVYNGGQVVTGNAIVAADFHVPTTNWPLVAHLIAVAERHLTPPRRLLLIGDLLNMDAASTWPKIVPAPSMGTEIRLAEDLITWLADVFDEIIFTLGNHEHRLFKVHQGELDHVMFGNLLSRLNRTGKLKLSPYSWQILISGGVEWRLTHPKAFSRNKLIVGSRLANKYKSNVIVAHQHHAAVGRDEWNTYTVIDNGGLFDYSQMAYTQLDDNASPVMSEGFSIVVDGAAELLTPYPSMTNWRRWLSESDLERLPRLVPWQERVRPPGLVKARRRG